MKNLQPEGGWRFFLTLLCILNNEHHHHCCVILHIMLILITRYLLRKCLYVNKVGDADSRNT